MALLNGTEKTTLRLGKADVKVGRPLLWNVYDEGGNLLYAEGALIHSPRKLEEMLEHGMFRKLRNIAPDQEKLRQAEEEERREAERRRNEDNRPLDQVPIKIGDVVQLQPLNEQSANERMTARLIGFVPGKSVMISTPVKNGKMVALRDGQAFLIRLFSGKSVYGFASHVVRQSNFHCSYVHFSYPRIVRGQILRHGVRAPVDVIAHVTNDAGASAAGRIQDLSTGGARLISKSVLGQPNDDLMINVRIRFDHYNEYLHIKGRIRSVNLSEDETSAIHGIQFIELPADYKFVLTAFIYRFLLAEQG